MHVDAGERQVTADRSLAALPTSLQATTLFEAYGELVDASGGVLEVQRSPQATDRRVSLSADDAGNRLRRCSSKRSTSTNLVMIGACNDVQPDRLRQHPEYPSFRGRLELVRVPYLRTTSTNQQIYDNQIVPQVRSTPLRTPLVSLAEFAVLKPHAPAVRGPLPEPARRDCEGARAVEKMDLYAESLTPARLSLNSANCCARMSRRCTRDRERGGTTKVESASLPLDPGTLLLDAGQREGYRCLSPFAVLEEIAEL